MADNRANGSIKCSERVYDATGVDACIEEASRKESKILEMSYWILKVWLKQE